MKKHLWLKPIIFFFFSLLAIISPQPASAQSYPGYPDLIPIGFDTCWEVYNHPTVGWAWKAWVWLKVKNQGSADSGTFRTFVILYNSYNSGIRFPYERTIMQGHLNFDSLTPKETQIVQGWFLSVPFDYTGPPPHTGSFCKTSGGDQGAYYDISYWVPWLPPTCIEVNIAGIYVDSSCDVVEDPGARCLMTDPAEINNMLWVDLEDKWRSDTVVPGHFDWLCSSQPRGTVTPTPSPVATSTPTSIPRPTSVPDKVYLDFEAESGSIRWPMKSVNSGGASGCYYLHSPEGSGHGKGDVTFKVDIPKTGYYVVFGRVNGAGWSSDSFYLSWDNGSEISWHIPHGWQWDKANHWGTPQNWKLTQGKHTLKIRTREDGSQIDALVVTNDSHYQPSYFQACR